VPAPLVTEMRPVVAPTGTVTTILVAVSETMVAGVPWKATSVAPETLRPVRSDDRVFVAAVWPAGAISCGWRESPRTQARECPEAEAALRSRRTICRVELANPRFQQQ
jgi:hypothetical protein